MGKTKCFKIRENFYVNELTVDMPVVPAIAKVETKHQYLIIDRSGSMWNELDSIMDILIEYTKNLPEGSTVSVGYFSGPGEYALTVPYTLKKEQDAVEKVLNTYRSSMGLTDFIEVLEKVEADVNGKRGALFFFTDGCHNSGGSFSKVVSILNNLEKHLDVSVFVGCGWIDRENMRAMAQMAGGSFVQLSDFSEFKQSLLDFGDSVKESAPGVEVELPAVAANICSLLGRNVVRYDVDPSFKIYYKASTRSKQAVYFTSTCVPVGYNESSIGVKDELPLRAVAYSLVQSNQTPLALEVLNAIGDKYYMRKLYNTFTSDEYAAIENELVKSIFDTRKRYKEGKTKDYLPDPNAFCVLDALKVLAEDPTAKIHLNDPDFQYSNISRKMEQTDGSKMIYPKDICASANAIKYHDSRLNASLSVTYTASVPLIPEEFTQSSITEEDLTRHGLFKGELYPVTCFRTYNIILDGKLKTKRLVLSELSKESKNALSDLLTLREDKKYILDFSNIPLINKSYLSTTSAKELAEDCWAQFLNSSKLSVLKYLQKRYKEDLDPVDSSDDKLMFLSENCYITRGSYQPPKTQAPSTDVYSAYEFTISFKGFSKASASSVAKKIDAGKTPTQRESVVAKYYEQYKSYPEAVLEQTIKQVSEDSRKLASKIQGAKLASILINRGSFSEFSSHTDMSIDIPVENMDFDRVTAEFVIVQKEVEI